LEFAKSNNSNKGKHDVNQFRSAEVTALDKNSLVGVIGAGDIGSGIAQLALQAGHPVALFDSSANAAAQAQQRIAHELQRLVEEGKASESFLEDCLFRLHTIEGLGQLAHAGLVIEAIVESLEDTLTVFQDLEEICEPTCILATNTPSLTLATLAACLKQPERVVGMCFSNSAPQLEKLEVISGLATNEYVVGCVHETITAWCKQLVHAPVP
jgi:3-hydroxybutyryl-CoA dehydrogenase